MKVINQISYELLFTFSKLNPSFNQLDLENFFITSSRLSKIDYSFTNKTLLVQAFTHKSFTHEAKTDFKNNERLEFLGDSILSIIITEYIFKNYKNAKEGDLSKLRSSIVNEDRLYDFALFLGLDYNMLVGKGELLNDGYKKKSLLSDVFEALLGAIYLDSNLETTKDFLLNLIKKFESKNYKVFIEDMNQAIDDKTKLQEIVYKKYNSYPKYESKNIDDQFEVALIINDQRVLVEKNKSKKKAMQVLASNALNNLKEI